MERGRWTLRTVMFDAVPGDPAHSHNVLPYGVDRGGALLAVEGEVKIGGGGFTSGTDNAHYGIALAHARLGDDARRAFAAMGQPYRRAETTLEITAYRRLTDWLALQPDVQYVSHPSWAWRRMR
jgi:hypothetical protein